MLTATRNPTFFCTIFYYIEFVSVRFGTTESSKILRAAFNYRTSLPIKLTLIESLFCVPPRDSNEFLTQDIDSASEEVDTVTEGNSRI